MRNGRVNKPTAGVSLFPFLAVLICTMGALIVLLILVVQQARVQAAVVRRDAAPEPSAPTQTEIHELEDFEWRRETLEKQRAEMTAKLAEERLALGHLEDHIRRLQDEWRRAVAQAEELNRTSQGKSGELAEFVAEKARLAREIEAAKSDLDEAKKKLGAKPRSFAIIPYDGPNGTHRRPIYIECRGDAIVFQPEGVVLGPADFEGPLGPGNPFDAALRATREYLEGAGAKQGGEPYPLLVVRPNGAVAYALARSAMKSWDDEFGYELVDQDMKLAYPAPDPQLAATLQRALQDARRRQEMLARMAPSRFKGIGSAGEYSPGTGVGPGTGGYGGEGFNERYGVGPGGGSSLASPSRSGSSASGTGGDSVAGTGHAGTGSTPGFTGGGSGNSPTGAFYGSTPPPGKTARPGSTGTTISGTGNKGSTDSTSAGGQANAGSTAGSPGGKMGSPTSGASGSSPGMPTLSFGSDDAKKSQADADAANDRQERRRRHTPNWGLPNSSASAVGFTRPIRIYCSAERLVILPERGDGSAPRVVPLVADSPAPIDDFVDAVWKHMDGWGIAGKRAYWKPVLSVQVAPGGEARYSELEAQLQGSGLEVKRK